MNKIYKVIWSKVKHQYVVVSELAHRDGKRSSAASKSVKTLMAVLAVCGMTAFGLGMQDVYAARETVTAEDGVAQAKEYQYVAIKTTEGGNKKTYEGKNGTSYTYHLETVGGVKYWVRDGYSIKLKTGDRYPGAAKHVQVVAYKTSADPSVDEGLLKSDQIMIEAAKDEDNHAITTFTGSVLNDVSAGTYVGATNEGGTQTPDDWNYIIQDSDGKYKDVTNATAIDGKKPKFVEAVKQADGTYTVNGEIVGTDNLYVIGEVTTTTEGPFWNPTTTKNTHYRLGAFVTSEGKIYDGRVFGLNNEVLMTAKEDDGTYYSYWAADTDDPMSPITNMTMGQFNTALKTIDDNSRMLAGDDIKQVDIAANGDGKTGGTIGLLRRGTYNTDTGKWEGTEYTPGIITVTSEGGIGGSGAENDVKIKFSNQENPDGFTVDAGTKVEAVQAAGSDKISALKINGQEYALGTGGTIAGSFNDLTGEISVTQDGQNVLTGRVHDWNVVSGEFNAQTGNLTLTTQDAYNAEQTDKVEIKGVASQTYVNDKDKLNVKYDNEAKNIVTLGGTGAAAVKLTNVANGENPSDAVNFSQLSEVKNAEDYVTGGSINNETGTITLNRQLGGKVEVSGLKTYISNNDEYATSASLEGNTLTINRHLGEAITVDLSELTSGMSATDYRLIGSGEDGTGSYAPDKNGDITLQVKDNKTGDVKNVTLTDIASAEDVTMNTTNIGILQEADKLNVKYDSPAKDSVTLGGTGAANAVKLTNVANGVNPFDAVNFSQLSEVKGEAGKHTTIEPTGTNITVTQNSAEGEALNYTVDLNPVVTLDGTAGDDKQIVLDGNNGTISAENSNTMGLINKTTTDNTFDFDENGGTFTTTETTTSLGGIVQKGTMKHEATFDGDGATFTKSALSLSEGPENSSTNIDGGTVTVQGDEIFGLGLTNKTVIDGGTITVTGSGLTGGRTVIDGKKITAGDIKVNNESGATITGLSNQTIDYAGFGGGRAATEAQLKLMQEQISDDLTVTASDGIAINSKNEISVNYGDGLTLSETKDETTGTKKLQVKGGDGVTVDGNGVSVNVGSNLEINDKNEVALQKDVDLGADGSLKVGGVVTLDKTGAAIGSVKVNAETSTVDGLANKEWTKEISDAIANKDTDAMGRAASQGQLYDVAEIANNAYTEAGKHTTMTVNEGMEAPKDGSYTTDGNLQLKQKVGDKGQIEYDVKLNDNLVLGKGDSQITLNGAPTDENAPAISVGEVFTVGQDGSVHAAVAGDSTSDSMSFTNGGLTISNMSGDVSSATVIKGADIQAGGIHLDGTDKIIDGLSNTTWTGMTTTPDKAATEGQLQMVSDTVASGWTATDDKGHKINVNPKHPTLNFASGKNITVSAENDEINVALNDNVYLGEDNAIALEGSTGHISATVKDSLGMSSNTLTFDDKGLTVSKDAMGVGSGSTNIIGDMITTTDENGNETTIDGGKVTTEALEVKGNSDNTMTFDAKGLNVNTGDAQLNVSEDRLSLNVDNGAGWNNSVKITQDGTTFSYSENGVTGATTTVIQGQKITAGDVLINGEDGKNTITGLTNTTWKNDAAWQADNIVADRAATEGQLQKAAAAATTTVSEGKNIDVTKTIDKEDGHTNYEVALQDNVSLGDGTILLNGVPKDGDALLNVDNKLVVEQDGTTTITVNDGTQMGDNTTVTVGADGVTFAGYGNGNTVINGQTIQAGGVFINDGGNGEITRLTNTTLDDPTFATVGRAATEEQLKLATDAATTTVSEGKNIDVNKTIDKEDGHTNYEVALQDNVSLGDGKIILNGKPEEGDDLLNVDNKLVVGQDGTTTIAVNDGTVAGGGNNTTVTVAADGVTFAGNSNGTTIINGQTIQAGGIYINDEETKGTIVGLTNTEWTGSTNEPSRAATEGQLQQAAAASKTTLSNGKNTTVTSKTAEDGHVDYQVNLNDYIVLGDQDGKNNNISINGNEASIILNGFENGEYKNSIEIDAASGTITGLTNAIGDGKDGWETFTDKDTVHGSRAVTEDDLYEVYRHGVQYGVSDDGSPDYTTIVLANPYNSDTKGGGTRITNVAYATGNNGSEAVNVDYLKDQIETATTGVTKNEKHVATNVGNTAEMPNADYSVGADGKVTLTEVDGNGNKTGNSVVISDVASASDLGDVDKLKEAGLGVDEKGNSNVVDAILDVDNKVGDLNYNDVKGDSIQNGDDTTTAIGKLDNRIDGLETDISGAAEEAKKHNTVEAGSNIVVTTSQNANGGTEYKVSVDPNLKVDTVTASGNIDAGSFSTGDITINKDNSGTINGLSNTTWNKEVADAIAANANGEAGTAATQGQLQQAMNGAVQYDTNKDGSVNKGSITLGGSTYNEETHEGGTTITNVADGKNASDAVNMSQLWQTNQAVINNSNNIQSLSNQVGKLDNRIDEVGAGAAALAALHPLDFDPDDKWDFSAGYGNYRGESAVAVGAFYRPNEDTMFSVGGTVGNGDNMVNAGVSFKIGQGNSVSTSRVAMAKEIKSMRDIVAKQDAQIQKLTAMVNALVGIQSEPDTTTMFPDVPENHWAYEAVEAMAKSGLVKGYPDGEFKGDRTMTRYEFAQIVYNAIQAGAEVDARLVEEFKPELEYFHIATVAKDKDGNPTIERVRAN